MVMLAYGKSILNSRSFEAATYSKMVKENEIFVPYLKLTFAVV